MPQTVFCKKYQQELPALSAPPFPGPKGQEIAKTISQKAWQEWQKHQTMLINERHLNMIEASARQFLQEEMDKFFSGEDYAKADGFVPEDK